MIEVLRAMTEAPVRLREGFRASPLAYRLARGAFWTLVGTVGARVFSTAASILVARMLGKEGFGEIGMVQSTMGLFGVFAGFGLGSATTKYVAEYRSREPERAGRVVVLGQALAFVLAAAVALVCAASSGWLAQSSLGRPSLQPLVASGALLLFFSALSGVVNAALSGLEAFRDVAIVSTLQGIAAPLLTVPLVWLHGTEGAVASWTAISALSLGAGAFLLGKRLEAAGISVRLSRSAWREAPIIWKFALPATLSSLLVAPVTWVTNAILVNQPDGYGQLGLFNAANQWRLLVVFLPGLLASAMLPVLSDAHGRADGAQFREALSMNLRVTWAVGLPMTVLVTTLGRPLAGLFGRQFEGSANVTGVLMASCLFMVLNSAVGVALAGSGRMWTGACLNAAWAAALVTGSLVLVPRHGAVGLAWAYLVAFLGHTLWTMAYVERKLAPGAASHLAASFALGGATLGFALWLSLLPEAVPGARAAVVAASLVPALQMLLRFRRDTVEPR